MRSRSLEEWERKKSYLIRSLFEDVPVLSPILEEHAPTPLSSPSNFVKRSESPLPELIVEVEPKKTNLHDDPEELYEALAKQMRRLYRKDFLNIELSTSSSENSCSESLNGEKIYDNVTSDVSDNDKALDENGLKDKYQLDYGNEYQLENDIDSLTKTDTSTSNESSKTFQSIILQVVLSKPYENLEREQQGLTESKQNRLSEEDSIDVTKTTHVNESIHGGDVNTDKENISDSESFAKDTNASSTNVNSESSVNSSQASPEIIRQRQRSVTFHTPPYHPVSESNSTISKTISLSMEVESKEYSEDFLTSNHELEIAEDSVNKTIMFVTSTPTRKRTSSRSSTTTGHKRRLVSHSSSSSFASVANVALQTSFSDCEKDWCSFWSKLFVGVPKAYNVCSCTNHVCTS